MNFTPNSEKKLSNFQQEYNNFLKPINKLPYTTHIGWIGKYYPAFKTKEKEKLKKDLWKLAKNHKIHSYGLEAIFVKNKNQINNPHTVLKTEDWLQACLPNNIQQENIEKHIQKRNKEIKKQLENKYNTTKYKSKKIKMNIDHGFEPYYGTYIYIGTK